MSVTPVGYDLWEIIDDEGISVFASHCQAPACGMPTFSRLSQGMRICRECIIAYRIAELPLPEVVLYDYEVPVERKEQIVVDCSECGFPTVRTQPKKLRTVCILCTQLKSRERSRRQRERAKQYA